MTLLLSFFMAFIFFTLYFVLKKRVKFYKNFFNAGLMFFSAGLMWSVDSFVSLINGEAFFDFSRKDLYLALIIAVSGILFFLLSVLIEVCFLNRYNCPHE